jgi:hypothetical protein
MRSLVIEDLTQLTTKMLALEVPAVQVQPVPVDKQQREVVGGAVIDLGMQYDAIGRENVWPVGAQ